MRALLWRAARAGCALAAAALVLAVTRWAPVHAQPPWDVRALPLFPIVLGLGVVAALCTPPGTAPRRARVRFALAAVLAAAAALALVVLVRPAAGLPVAVLSAEREVAQLPSGAIDVSGPRLRALPFVRRWTFRWEGELRAPRSGDREAMLIFEDRRTFDNTPNTIAGQANSTFEGVIYMPNSKLNFSGGSNTNARYTSIVVDTLSLTGQSRFNADYSVLANGAPLTRGVLVQ